MNWLEKLGHEFYEAQGHWVQANVPIAPQKHGGYKGEADVLAYHRLDKTLVHVEFSEGAASWEETKITLERKFKTATLAFYQVCFLAAPIEKVERIAVVGWGYKPPPIEISGIQVLTVHEFAQRIIHFLGEVYSGGKAPPEKWPLLRTLFLAMRFYEGFLASSSSPQQ